MQPKTEEPKLFGMLEDLKKEELEKFKWFLRDRDVLVELQPIPKSRLEKASTCDLVDLMVQTYTEKSVEVTTKVLKKINRNDLRERVEQEEAEREHHTHTKQFQFQTWSSVCGGDHGGKHFVDKHRVQLIQRVSNVAPILDDLLGSDVISQESYNSIMALPTSQDKMRTLYSHLNTERCNDIFYKILLENEKHLIDEFSAK
uniref:PYD and CARD domain containing n=1 Tax=Neolamprologus brichardi TaxID=32507 RepID=A0A3Q4GVQ0_NEOBR